MRASWVFLGMNISYTCQNSSHQTFNDYAYIFFLNDSIFLIGPVKDQKSNLVVGFPCTPTHTHTFKKLTISLLLIRHRTCLDNSVFFHTWIMSCFGYILWIWSLACGAVLCDYGNLEGLAYLEKEVYGEQVCGGLLFLALSWVSFHTVSYATRGTATITLIPWLWWSSQAHGSSNWDGALWSHELS